MIASVVASMAYASSGSDFRKFNVIVRIPNQYSYTDTIPQRNNNEPVKFFPMESTSDDTFVYIDVKILATNNSSNIGGGNNVTCNEEGALIDSVNCQVGYVYELATVKNYYKNIFLGISSDTYNAQGYTVSGIWGYGTI